jgi:hypothetical protein
MLSDVLPHTLPTNAGFWYDVGRDYAGPMIGGAAAFVGGRYTMWRERRKKRHVAIVNTDHTRDIRVYQCLTELGIHTCAIRAYVSRYINGEQFMDGSDLVKKTRTHEWTNGVTEQADYFQSILISRIPEETSLVLEAGHSFTLVKDLHESMFKEICKIGRSGAIARASIKMGKKVVGFVGLDWNLDVCEPPPEIDKINDAARRIEFILFNA